MRYSYTIYGWTKTLGAYGRNEGKQCKSLGEAIRLIKVLLKKYDRVSVVGEAYLENGELSETKEKYYYKKEK